MINQERVASMTQMAILNKGNCRKDVEISKYYKYDYITLNMINCMFWVLVLYSGLVCGGVILMFENILSLVIADELLAFMIMLVYGLIILWVITLVFSFFVYRKKYMDAHETGREYYCALAKVNRLYIKEKKAHEYK